MVVSIYQDDFLSKSVTAIREFLENLVEKIMQWETTRNDNISSRYVRGGLYSVSNVSYLGSNIAVLENILKGLSPQMTQLSQISTVSYLHCQALDHSLSACPYFAHLLANRQEQVSMTFQRSKNDPFSPYCNSGWRNHPNFSWSNGLNVMVLNFQSGVLLGNNSHHISHPSNFF